MQWVIGYVVQEESMGMDIYIEWKFHGTHVES